MTAPGADAFSLTRLFIAPDAVPPATPTLGQDWVGGQLVSWDPVSYANLVKIGPIFFTNLPVVSPNGLTLGVVLLAKAPGGYVILGNLASVRNPALLDPIRYRYLQGDITLPNTTFQDAGVLNFLMNTNTAYGIDGTLFFNSTTSNDIKFAWTGPANMSAKWSMFGLNNATTHSINSDTVANYGDGSPQTVQGLGASSTCKPAGWFATTDTPGLLQLRVALDSGSTAGSLQQGSWLRISELGPFGGANTYIKLYPATGSRSYKGDKTFIGSPDGDNNLYTWSLSGRSFGSEAHMWTFDAATMRTDLAGATVLSAQMFLYCVTGSSIPADLSWRWSTTSSIATTFPDNGFAGGDVKNLWQANSWASFDISTQIGNVLNNNANSVLGGSYNFTDSATEFRGYGSSVATRPYLQIMYSV